MCASVWSLSAALGVLAPDLVANGVASPPPPPPSILFLSGWLAVAKKDPLLCLPYSCVGTGIVNLEAEGKSDTRDKAQTGSLCLPGCSELLGSQNRTAGFLHPPALFGTLAKALWGASRCFAFFVAVGTLGTETAAFALQATCPGKSIKSSSWPAKALTRRRSPRRSRTTKSSKSTRKVSDRGGGTCDRCDAFST